MTRSHKYTDRDHKGIADGSVSPTEHLPRFFAKSGHVDADPKKIKKDGGGKGNWYVSDSFFFFFFFEYSFLLMMDSKTGAVLAKRPWMRISASPMPVAAPTAFPTTTSPTSRPSLR